MYGTGINTRNMTPISWISPPHSLGGVPVAELVNGLYDDVGNCHQQEILARERHGDGVVRQRLPMPDRKQSAKSDHDQPHGETDPAEYHSNHRDRQVQKSVGIEQRDAQRQRVHHSHQDFPARALARPLGELSHVGQQIAVQQIGMMKLRQEMDGLVLGRQLLDIVGAGGEVFPNLMDGAPSIHHAQHLMGGGRQSVELTGLVVLEHIPGLTAKALPVNLGVCTEPGPDVRDPVPRRTEERLRHGSKSVLSPTTAMRRRGASP